MFKKIGKCSVSLLLPCITAFATINSPPASYQRVIHSLDFERKGDALLTRLTLQDGLTFYSTISHPSENEIMNMEATYVSGKNIYFVRLGEGILSFDESWELLDSWYLPIKCNESLPKVVSIEFLEREKSVPSWFSSPGFIMTLSDGSKWKAREGTLPLWGETQVGDTIFIHERYTDCGYYLINLDRGYVDASEQIQNLSR